MSRLIILKGGEGLFANSGTGNTFFDSTCVRLFVKTDSKLSILDEDNNYIGNTSFKAAGTQEYFISKKQACTKASFYLFKAIQKVTSLNSGVKFGFMKKYHILPESGSKYFGKLKFGLYL